MRYVFVAILFAAIGCEKPDCRKDMIEAGYPPGCIVQHSATTCVFDSAGCQTQGLTFAVGGAGGDILVQDSGAPFVPNDCTRTGAGDWPKLVQGVVSAVPFRLFLAAGALTMTIGNEGAQEATSIYTGTDYLKAYFGDQLLIAEFTGNRLDATLTANGDTILDIEGLDCP